MDFLTAQILRPLVRRAGSILAAYLVGLGVAHEVAATIELGLVAALGVALDLVLEWRANRSDQ